MKALNYRFKMIYHKIYRFKILEILMNNNNLKILNNKKMV